jgi:hypothetical protein
VPAISLTREKRHRVHLQHEQFQHYKAPQQHNHPPQPTKNMQNNPERCQYEAGPSHVTSKFKSENPMTNLDSISTWLPSLNDLYTFRRKQILILNRYSNSNQVFWRQEITSCDLFYRQTGRAHVYQPFLNFWKMLRNPRILAKFHIITMIPLCNS